MIKLFIKISFFSLGLVTSVAGLLLMIFLFYSIKYNYDVKDKIMESIPPYIKVDEMIDWSGSYGLMQQTCGVLVFKLSSLTIDNIRSDENFLVKSAKAISYRVKYGDFTKWSRTPVSESDFSEGLPYSIVCAKHLNRNLRNLLIEQMRRPDGYRGDGPYCNLIIDMKNRLIYFLYYVD